MLGRSEQTLSKAGTRVYPVQVEHVHACVQYPVHVSTSTFMCTVQCTHYTLHVYLLRVWLSYVCMISK